MKYLGILFVVFLLSCETKNVNPKKSDMTINGRTLEVYEIDGCEYIGYVSSYTSDFLTHKGNCKNPIHYCK